ncbi:MAG: TonB-dependent receptor [Ignavibacteriae bacterium]|nr:TonB-dependent receptor [Ignavibacteriota bacterium]
MNRIVNNSAYTPEFIDTFNTSFVSDLAHLSNIDNAYSYKNSGYVENIIQIKDNVILNIAGRFDYFDMNKETTYSPRFNIAYSTDFGTVFRAAWGHYYQTPIYTQLKYSNSSPNNTKSQMAIHYVAGIEQDFNLSNSKISTLKVKLDLYYKDYQNLISSYYSHYSKLFYSRNNDAAGFAKGIDTYILLNIPRFYTWVSYGYLVAMEDEKNDNKGAYQRLTGQTHTFSWVTDFNLGSGWSLNSKYYYGSGFPYAEKTLYYYKESNEYIWESEPNTTSILPAYSRLDFRISKMF